MKVIIEYEASWGNSFLDGSNNEPLPSKGRDFIATGKKLSKNYYQKTVTKDTVMGLLNRLIGDQRKLYQSRQDENYYLKDIEEVFNEKTDLIDKPTAVSEEVVFLRNIGKSDDQNSFVGLLKNDSPIFTSAFSPELWGILWLDFQELYSFVINETYQIKMTDSVYYPLRIKSQIEQVGAIKLKEENLKQALEMIEVFKNNLVDYKFESEKPKILSLYLSALYIQINRLLKTKEEIKSVLTKKGNISGISCNSFTAKDFLGAFSGGKKRSWGAPYLFKERIKGAGEVTHRLTKKSGVLTILLKISKERAENLKQRIEEAAVAPFYLGKKGLAYVTKIDTREVE
ncbi:MAG: type I-Fv CRISPR-associated protein Cas5fv [Candidatus Riflebacteria bacterium]|nr:type I-Fv CRISPR-associated protein Cas5fv [Candidatus Riflebacteria bacterium]